MTPDTFRSALDDSRLLGGIRWVTSHAAPTEGVAAVRRGSRTVEAGRRLLGSLRAGLANAAVGRAARRAAAASRGAATTAVANRGARAVRASWLYRWLTAEPDPAVVVIDLRETVTVAPFVALLHGTVRRLLAAVPRSAAVAAAARTESSLPDEPVRNASIMALGVVLVGVLVSAVRGLPDTVMVALLLLALMAVVGTRIRLTWDELTESWPGRLLRAALEPPEPPEER